MRRFLRADFIRALSTVATAATAGCSLPSLASSAAATPAVALTPQAAQPRTLSAGVTPQIIKPPRLRPGDAVGIVACGSPARSPLEISRAKTNIELLGLVPVITPHLSDTCGYLAGPDSSRLYQFNAFARDPDIRGIIALRGGYGTMRLLGGIDYDAFIRDPKVLIGFSDITALLNAISSKTGLITFHGPVAGHGDFTETVIRGLRRAVMSTKPLGQIAAADDPRQRTTMYPPASGRIFGGNLSLVAALCGTPYAIPSAASLLLLEEVNEAPYRVDRMLTQLRLAGYLDGVAGIALGQFVHCVPNEDTDDVPSFSIAETLNDRLFGLRCPIVANFPFGHIAAQATIPIGARATLDAQALVMSIDEAAVS